VDDGFYLGGPTCAYGLPTFTEWVSLAPSYAQPEALIQPLTTKICPDSCIAFGNLSTNATGYEWFFQGGVPGYSTDAFPTVCYSYPGSHDVTLVAHNGPLTDTTTMTGLIEVYSPPFPFVYQSNDTLYEASAQPGYTYQWYYNGNPLSGATNSFYIPNQNGTYTVNVTNAEGCGGSDESLVGYVGIETTGTNTTFQVYPNPADRFITVIPNSPQPATVSLYNPLGQMIYSRVVAGSTGVNVASLAAGLYYVTLQTAAGLETRPIAVTHR
jgi:hypothetical protein